MTQLMPNIDLLFGNEDEIVCFARVHGLLPPASSSLDPASEEYYFRILEALQKTFPSAKGERQIVVTRGS